MKKIFASLLIITASILFCSYSEAGVRSILDSDNAVGHKSKPSSYKRPPDQFHESDTAKCRRLGYQRVGCPDGYNAVGRCPHAEMYRECCPPEYQYTEEQCEAMGRKASTRKCNQLRMCY